jgi:hypothetical protein
LDAHQLYPAACRYDESLYNDSHILWAVRLGVSGTHVSPLDLAVARRIRENMTQRLGLGEEGITRALLDGFLREKKIQSDFVEEVMRNQGVDHYARVDTRRLSDADRRKFNEDVRKVERELGRLYVEAWYELGGFEERWQGVFLAKNPSVAYRNKQTGETLIPRVPVRYFEDTERKRWAYEVWKRTRPERSALQAPESPSRPKFEIHPAVEAIENWPFFHALAPAKGLDLGNNILPVRGGERIEHLQEFETAFTSLERWIGQMHWDLAKDAGLPAKVESLGLGNDVRQALHSVGRNLDVFRVRTGNPPPLAPTSPDLPRLRNLQNRALKVRPYLEGLQKAFANHAPGASRAAPRFQSGPPRRDDVPGQRMFL